MTKFHRSDSQANVPDRGPDEGDRALVTTEALLGTAIGVVAVVVLLGAARVASGRDPLARVAAAAVAAGRYEFTAAGAIGAAAPTLVTGGGEVFGPITITHVVAQLPDPTTDSTPGDGATTRDTRAMQSDHGATTRNNGAMQSDHGATTRNNGAMQSDHGATTRNNGAMTHDNGATTPDLVVAWPHVRSGHGSPVMGPSLAAMLPAGDPIGLIAAGHAAATGPVEDSGPDGPCRRVEFLVAGRAYSAWWSKHPNAMPVNGGAGLPTFAARATVWHAVDSWRPCRIVAHLELPRVAGDHPGHASVEWRYDQWQP